MNVQSLNPSFPKKLKYLLIAIAVLPIAKFVAFPDESGGTLFWAALFIALSLSVWVGKDGAAKGLGYLLYFLGAIAPLTLLVMFHSWPSIAFLLVQAAVHIITARELIKGEQLRAYYAANNQAET